jgi:hypothetical protein
VWVVVANAAAVCVWPSLGDALSSEHDAEGRTRVRTETALQLLATCEEARRVEPRLGELDVPECGVASQISQLHVCCAMR